MLMVIEDGEGNGVLEGTELFAFLAFLVCQRHAWCRKRRGVSLQ